MDHDSEYQPIDLREYLSILRARKWWIIGTVALVLGSALAVSFQQTPMYTASARLLVKPILSGGFVGQPGLDTEAEVVDSIPVATLASEELGGVSPEQLLQGLSVDPVIDTQVLVVKYTDEDATVASRNANAFANSYIQYRREQALTELRAAQDAIQGRLESTQQRLSLVAEDLQEARDAGQDELARVLEAEQGTLIARLGVLQQRVDDVQPESSVRLGGGEVIEAAVTPRAPSSPDHAQNAGLATFLGLALGVGLAFLRDRLDDRFRGRTDVERVVQAPVLVTVPKYQTSKGDSKLAVLEAPDGLSAEAYRTLRTNVQFLAAKHQAKSLLVTSPRAGEGKTVTAVNLAVSLAQSGKRVIVVSADMRRPTLESYFGLRETDTGLSLWLIDNDESPWAMLQDPNVGNLRIVTAGPTPPNPAEILSSPRLVHLIRTLEENCDYVVLDAPPVLGLADAGILTSIVGGTLLVLDVNTTPRSQAQHAREELERLGGRIIGAIQNAYDPSSAESYYGTYYARYKSEPAENGNQAKTKRWTFTKK